MRKHLPLLAVVGALFVAAAVVRAFPKPSVHPVSWELGFEHGTPTRITVKTAGADAPKAYWYMTFKVTNNTREDQLFLPVFEMVDDKGNVHRSDKAIPADVFTAIKQQERKKLMEPLAAVSGKLLQGEDQARDSVAIWEEPVERMGTFSIFVSGLSGEAVWYKDGKATEARDMKWAAGLKPEEAGAILRKTLHLQWQVPGDDVYQGRDVRVLKTEEWVMR